MDLAILTLIPYLDDYGKLQLLSTCKVYRELLTRIEFTEIYNYITIKHLPYNFVNVEYTFNFSAYEVNKMQELSGFNLGLVPARVTILHYSSSLPIEDVIQEGVREIHLHMGAPIRCLPRSVKVLKLHTESRNSYDHLKGITIIPYIRPQSAYIPAGSIAIGTHASVMVATGGLRPAIWQPVSTLNF